MYKKKLQKKEEELEDLSNSIKPGTTPFFLNWNSFFKRFFTHSINQGNKKRVRPWNGSSGYAKFFFFKGSLPGFHPIKNQKINLPWTHNQKKKERKKKNNNNNTTRLTNDTLTKSPPTKKNETRPQILIVGYFQDGSCASTRHTHTHTEREREINGGSDAITEG